MEITAVNDQVFAYGEDSHTLRLASELADLRVGNVNWIFAKAKRSVQRRHLQERKKQPVWVASFLWRADKKDIFKSFRMDLNSCATSRREACMESMQSIVWNPLQDGMESSRRKCTFGDSIRLRRYHTRWRVITYQACGLNKKIDKSKLVDFFGGDDQIWTDE